MLKHILWTGVLLGARLATLVTRVIILLAT
jgi:hypothetical protein